MRGSVYYQTSQLAKAVFEPGVSKLDRIEQALSGKGQMRVASFKTMETYRRVWNNFGKFVRDEFGLRDLCRVEPKHVEGYMLSKIDIAPSRQYMEKISSALGKMEFALTLFCEQIGSYRYFDFSVRHQILARLKEDEVIYDGYHNRAYLEPEKIIEAMKDDHHRLAARIQLHSGTRFEGVGLIRSRQLQQPEIDPVSGQKVVPIITQEKGGNVGLIYIAPKLARELEARMVKGVYQVEYQKYMADIRQACESLGVRSEGSHGFRWCFAKNRMNAYQSSGYSYNATLLRVSAEMKHRRACITEHYHGFHSAK